MMSDESVTPDPSLPPEATITPVARPEPPSHEEPEESEGAVVFKTREAFNERIQRQARAEFRKRYGDPDEIEERLSRLDALEEEAAERRRAQMDEVERLAEELAEARSEADQAEHEAQLERYRRLVTEVATKHGVTRTKYMMRDIEEAAESLDDDEELDLEEFVAAQLEDAEKRLVYGVAEQQDSGVTTTVHAERPDAPRAGAPRQGQKSVWEMTPQEFAKYSSELHGV